MTRDSQAIPTAALERKGSSRCDLNEAADRASKTLRGGRTVGLRLVVRRTVGAYSALAVIVIRHQHLVGMVEILHRPFGGESKILRGTGVTVRMQ